MTVGDAHRAESLTEIRDTLWSMMWSGAHESEFDAVAEVRAMRDQDNEISDRNFNRRAAAAARPPSVESEMRGRAVLDALDL